MIVEKLRSQPTPSFHPPVPKLKTRLGNQTNFPTQVLLSERKTRQNSPNNLLSSQSISWISMENGMLIGEQGNGISNFLLIPSFPQHEERQYTKFKKIS